MTPEEKAVFCCFVSVALAEPKNDTMVALGNRALRDWLVSCVNRWSDAYVSLDCLFGPVCGPDGLAVLQKAYERLFDRLNGLAISLVESTYKPWAQGSDCGLVFAAETGLLMGDSALHMNELYKAAAIEVPSDFRSTPDHIVLELEFLSLLYEYGSDEKAKAFIVEHLDWIPMLREQVEKAEPHPFYQCIVELLDLFIKYERNIGKDQSNGTTHVH